MRGGGENLLRDGISRSGSFDYNGKEFGENSVGTFGDTLKNRIPILSFGGFGGGIAFFSAKNFFAERSRWAEMVAGTEGGFDGAAANVVGAAWVADPWSPATGASRFSGEVATVRGGACAGDDYDSRFEAPAIAITLSESGFERDFDVGDDANRGLRECMTEVAGEAARDARASGASNARADGANVFGFLAGFSESAAGGVFERKERFRESGTQRIGGAAGGFAEKVTRSIEDDAICFCAASVKAEEDAHASRSSFCRR